MHKYSIYFILSIIFSLITLVSCSDEQPKWLALEKQAIGDAEVLGGDAHYSYLQCYPLDYQYKKQCVQLLNDKYIKDEYKSDPQYSRSFQYKAEKLGFLKFLGSHNLPCSGIDHGPQFVKSVNAYQVNCTCGNSFLVQFDYENKKWHLKQNNSIKN